MSTKKLNFDVKFKNNLINGKKLSTILKHSDIMEGDYIMLCSDGSYIRFVTCKETIPIEILWYQEKVNLILNKNKDFKVTMTNEAVNTLVEMEGFDSRGDFFDFFKMKYGLDVFKGEWVIFD